MEQQTPSIGRIVHYVLNAGRNAGEHRPAIIVRVWPGDLVNLQVFPDSNEDGTSNDCLPVPMWQTSIRFDADGANHTWHWPERV